MDLKKSILNYVPYDDREEKEKELFLKFIDNFDDVLTRENEFGHFSSSALVVNKDRNKVLMVYHNILKGWTYPGGHADGESNLLSVAIREVKEETNQNVNVLYDGIFGINANPVPPHVKRGKMISSHVHYDVIYLLEAKEDTKLRYRPNESNGLKWVTLNEACFSNEVVDYAKPINQRLIAKMQGGRY